MRNPPKWHGDSVITIEWKRNTKRLLDVNLVEIYIYLVELWVFKVGDDAWLNRAWARGVHEPVDTSIEYGGATEHPLNLLYIETPSIKKLVLYHKILNI